MSRPTTALMIVGFSFLLVGLGNLVGGWIFRRTRSGQRPSVGGDK